MARAVPTSALPQIPASDGVHGSDKPVQPGTDPSHFSNREKGWLDFNSRVLHEAEDERTPLLERVNFLSIFTSNLDEFFMKRVGGLDRQASLGVTSRSADGLTADEQLAAIRTAVIPLLQRQAACYRDGLKPALAEADIHLLDWSELTRAEKKDARAYFRANVFPVLTPLAVDPGHPFPFISNLSLNLAVILRPQGRETRALSRVKVPQILPSWIRLLPAQSSKRYRYISLHALIRNNLELLFPSMEIMAVSAFRVTRNADIERDEEDADDLLELVEEELRARRIANAVRIEHGPDPDPWALSVLLDELELSETDAYTLDQELDYTGLRQIAELPLPELKYTAFQPAVPSPFADPELDMFRHLRSTDVLVHHPYESFTATVQRFLNDAADDPLVVAIKMTLYRTGDESPFISTLIRAAQAGKEVVCLVEVKARFDEQRNIQIARMLEDAGVHVVYGFVDLKTHNKTALVIRQEPEGLRCYAHIGTGNYHAGTARLYTDFGLFTAKRDFTNDVVELFHYLTGQSLKGDYRKLLVAPPNMHEPFLEMIRNEARHANAGRPARVLAKMNALEDRRIISALYEASAAGVQVDLVVRGFCCLRAGIKGLSENIRVVSVVGRFLEHSRAFYFRNGAQDPMDGRVFIGSADWMTRNLDSRIEAVVPIEDRPLRERCIETLELLLADRRQGWELQADGRYLQRTPTDADTDTGTHERLLHLARRRAAS